MIILAFALSAIGSPAGATITSGGERAASPARLGGSITGGAVSSHAGDVNARCWQAGREILHAGDFAQVTLSPELRQQAVSLEGSGRSALLLPFADTFCLLTITP